MEKQIQWFPGHMAKAYRQMKEKIGLVDVIIEVLDSRIPNASLNKNLREIIGNKPLLRILNKADLSDEKETDKWCKKLNQDCYTIKLDSLNGDNIKKISQAMDIVLKDKIEKAQAVGKRIYPIRAMVVGVPNVGKSTLLNNLAKRKALETGDRPGVTKNMTYLRANDKLLLLDNPGTLWPKMENDRQGKLLALIGSIKDQILPLATVADFGLTLIREEYPEKLMERYKLDSLEGKTNNEILIEIGRKRGAIQKGGEVDLDKVNDLFLRELRSAKIGRFTYEKCE